MGSSASFNRDIGVSGEQEAEKFLVKHGYEIIDRNFSKPWGEIDIVGRKKGVITFFEIKTSEYRGNSDFYPEMRVNKRKSESLRRVCETFLEERKMLYPNGWQIDVISVILNTDRSVNEINHIESAVCAVR